VKPAWYDSIMAERKRKPRSFTLPDSFMERLAEAARQRDTTMSQLIQEYGLAGLRLDDELRKLVESGQVFDASVSDLRQIPWLMNSVRAKAYAADADEHAQAVEDLNEALSDFNETWFCR